MGMWRDRDEEVIVESRSDIGPCFAFNGSRVFTRSQRKPFPTVGPYPGENLDWHTSEDSTAIKSSFQPKGMDLQSANVASKT